MTLVDGIVRYDHGVFPHVDHEKIYANVRQSCQRILAEL